MAKQFYQLSGSDLVVWDDPQNLTTKAALETVVAGLVPFQALPAESRAFLAQAGVPGAGIPGGFPDLATFDTALNDEIERLQDLIDYYDYSSKQETIGNVRDGAWFIPEAVEAVSGEEAGNEAVLAIDGANSTFWRTNTGPGSITFRLRSHRKNIESIRLWIPNNVPITELQGLTIRGAQSLGMIDDASNILATGLNLAHTPGTAFQVIPITNPSNPNGRKRLRYIKLDIAGSNHSQGHIAIRSIEARVVTFNHIK